MVLSEKQGLVLPTRRMCGSYSLSRKEIEQVSCHSHTPSILLCCCSLTVGLKMFLKIWWPSTSKCIHPDQDCSSVATMISHVPRLCPVAKPFCLIFKFSCYAVYYIQSLTSGKSTCSLISDQYCLWFTQMPEITLPTASHKLVMAFHLNWI